MKKIMIAIVLATSVFAQDPPSSCGEGCGYASRDATVLSMMGWGVVLAVGIGALVTLIPNHTTANH